MDVRRLMAVGCVCVGVSVAAVDVAGASSGAVAARPSRSRAAVARHDARALVARVNLPAGATPASTEPAGDNGYLKPMPELEADLAHAVAHAWWTVSGSPTSVLAYVRRHPPAGGTFSGSGSASDERTGTSAVDEAYSFPAEPPALGERELQITATALSNGTTGVLVEGQSDWIVPRSPSERIPHTVDRIVIVGRVPTNRRGDRLHRYLALSVTRSSQIARIIQVVNRLPVAQPITLMCPVFDTFKPDPERLITMSFERADSSQPVARLVYDRLWPGPSGACDPVRLTIEGRARRPLLGGTFLRAIGTTVGRSLTRTSG